ncbi:MAG: InlB B-repeat-containing protein [Oscillospiraceae bacterium]|nr:InlB B-repeat-containing protein [Oscillospiraceae bacterium]
MKTKRILSVALTLVMLIGLFPGMGLTASAAGSTTEITPSNTSGTLTITLKIKADQAAPAAPTASSVTINSITLNTITNGEYKMGDGEWQDSPAFTGLTMNTEYTFYQRIKGDENHNTSPASSANISTSNHAHSWSYEASGATITATCSNTDGGHSGELAATLTVVAPALTVYGGTGSAEATITGSIDGVTTPGIVYKKGADTLPAAPADAGTYTAKIPMGDATASVEYTVAKADPSCTAPTGLTATYGQTLAAVTLPDGWTWADDTQSVGSAGPNSFPASFTPTDTANYNSVENVDVIVTVNKAAITITADDKSSKYDDDLVELTYTVGGAYKAGDELGVTLNTTATKTSDVGEYPITVSWNENANYTATVTSGKYTITTTGLTVNATGYTGAYDGAAHGISVDVGSSGATVYYAAEALTAENYATAGSTTNPTYTDAGEYTVYFYVVSGNYDPDTISGSKTVSINKATMTKNELTAAQKPTAKTDLVADNTDQALVTAPASLPEGYTAIQYSLDGETWTDTIPTGKDAGDYTVNYKYVGDSNHNDFQGEPLTVTIKTLTVTFEVNGGSAVEAQSVVKGDTVARPADPTKAGNAFDGWFQDATFSVYFDFAAPVTDDVTLYAKWTPNDYTLTSITGTSTDISHTWVKDSSVSFVITAKLTTEPDDSFAHFIGVQLDGTTLVRDTDYTAREGSTIVTLVPATLQKLSVGAHTVTILYDNGRVDARLTVLQPSSSPKTGDESHAALWLAVLAVSGVGMAATLLGAKKRRMAKR